MSERIAVLFARKDSVYKTMPECDVYDIDRDARTYDGPWPVVAHPSDAPPMPLKLGTAECVVGDVGRASRGDNRPEITKAEREHTPPELARWLVDLASRCSIARKAAA